LYVVQISFYFSKYLIILPREKHWIMQQTRNAQYIGHHIVFDYFEIISFS